MMTSRQRVLCAFAHQEPDRVPAWCGASVEFWNKARRELHLDDEGLRVRLGDDFRRVFAPYRGPAVELLPGATCVTPFGVQRRASVTGNPSAIPWPVPTSRPSMPILGPIPHRSTSRRSAAKPKAMAGSTPFSAATGRLSGTT